MAKLIEASIAPITSLLGIGGAPDAPKPRTAPAPDDETTRRNAERERQRMMAAGGGGRASTILTGSNKLG